MQRYVWANTRSRRLHGVVRPADGELGLGRGTVYELALLDARAGLAAFDAVAASPGSFTIVTRDGTTIYFLFGPSGPLGVINRLMGRVPNCVALDLSYEVDEEPALADFLEVDLISARSVVEHVFSDVPDGELWRRLGIPVAG